jgi:hypothetical protein
MFASPSPEPAYDVSLSSAEADVLCSLRGREVEVLLPAGDEWGFAVRLVTDTVSLSIVPEEFPTPTKDSAVLDVERPVVKVLADEGGEERYERHSLGVVHEVAVHTTMIWWSAPGVSPLGGSSHERNAVRPGDVASLERAREKAITDGFDPGLTRLDIGLEVLGARPFTVWTELYFLYWALGAPSAHMAEIAERRLLG